MNAFDLFLPQAGEQLACIRWLRLAQLHCSIVHQVSIVFDQIILFSSLVLCHCQHLDVWHLFVLLFICSSGFQCGSCTSVRTSSRLLYENLPKIHVDDRVFKSVRILTHLICLPRFDMYLYITSCQSRPCVKETTLKTSYKHLYIYSGSLICHLCCYDFLGQKGCWAIDKSCIS